MPRATTKPELLTAAQSQWDKLWALINSMPLEEQTAPFTFDVSADKEAHWSRDKNLRDVLVHLYEWHQLLLSWVEANQNGKNAPFLPVPYNWKTYGDMNAAFWEKHQATSYDDAQAVLRESHSNVLAVIETFTDEELFEKKHFPWTGTSSLGSYCVSVTVSHYEWAMKKIKRHIRER
ncbi:MAG: ClbS/DfsB family four-helix bundle protein [Oscillospiraceae bacterium]|jgi:hypothetical protein|nr:ClbS/DfsB family four-helix bundle protein [Oscillospiraceae bacterium]